MNITERGGAGAFSCNTSFLAIRAFVGAIAEPCSAIVAVRVFVGEITEPRSAIVAIRAFEGELAEPRSAIVEVRPFVGELTEPRSANVEVRPFVGEERSCSKVFTFEIASCIERLDEYKIVQEDLISDQLQQAIQRLSPMADLIFLFHSELGHAPIIGRKPE
jgi:hypothetical protein